MIDDETDEELADGIIFLQEHWDGGAKGQNFIPAWDDTDHIQFVCYYCKKIAIIQGVQLSGSVLYFFLRCPDGHAHNFRKMYLNDVVQHHLITPKDPEKFEIDFAIPNMD